MIAKTVSTRPETTSAARTPAATKSRMAAATKAIQSQRAARVSAALKKASSKTGLFRG